MNDIVRKQNTQTFIEGYLICALWSSSDSGDPKGGEHLDQCYTTDDIVPGSRKDHELQCENFIAANWNLLTDAVNRPGYSWGSAGHDFWLTRNGHGAGYFDRGLGATGDALQELARVYGSCDPYVGDTGHVYLS